MRAEQSSESEIDLPPPRSTLPTPAETPAPRWSLAVRQETIRDLDRLQRGFRRVGDLFENDL